MSNLTPEGIVNFPSLFEKSRMSEKYEVTLAFKPEDLAPLKEAAARAVKEKWGDKTPSNMRSPFRPCSDNPDYFGNMPEGSIRVCFKTDRQPQVVDNKVQPILDRGDVYPGCLGRASYSCYAYDFNGNKGVGFGLNNFQKTRDGEAIAGMGGANADQEFTPVEGGESVTVGGDDLPF